MTSRRWLCPQCGAGVLGPSRPRRDDVRRYCLACSQKTGRLVERTCPALERERTATRVALTNRSHDRAQAALVARRMAGGVDLLAEAHRYAKLPALQRRLRHRFPEIIFRRSTTKVRTSGHYWTSYHRIVVTVGTDPSYAPATVLHEMVHAALPHEAHTARFWSTLRQAAREAWPAATFDFLHARDGWTTQQAIRNGIAALAVGSSYE